MSNDPIRAAQSLTRPERPRRFYKDVTIGPNASGEAVLLDGGVARTPARRALAVPTRALAEALAAEWRAQGEHIDLTTMPMTRLVNIVLDGVAAEPERVRDDVVSYAGSDLVCYRADGPVPLLDLQRRHWDPLIRWAGEAFGARLTCAEGVMHVVQSGPAISAFRAALVPLDPFRLAALHSMTTLTGSAVIALAAWKRRLTPDEAWAAAHVDEDWNIAQWGEDAEAAARRSARKAEMDAAARLLALLEAEP